MRKTTRKLEIRSQTIRTLQTLESIELTRVVGGDDTSRTLTGVNCPAPRIGPGGTLP